jgi:hypothetical protein
MCIFGLVGTDELSRSLSLVTQILELIRDGDKTVTDLMDLGKQLLGRWVYLLMNSLLRFLHHYILFIHNVCTIKTWHYIASLIR